MNNHWKKFIPGCIAGNILELYEFIIYGYFASIIGVLFFPTQNKYPPLIAAFAVFATGSLVRPFSAIIFGYLGDKFGRRLSLIISVGLMATSTFMMGLLPTYSQIGLLAPIMLVICRVSQGLSMTGEEIGAALFLMENAPSNQKGYASCLILGSVYLGLLFGSLVSSIIFLTIHGASLTNWGWRIPFLLGGIVGFFVLIIRFKQPESSEFQEAIIKNKISSNPIKDVIRRDIFSIVKSTLLFCLIAVAVYLFAVYIPNTLKLRLPESGKHIILLICSFGFALTFLTSLAVGKLVDRIGTQIPIALSAFGFIFLSYPLFLLLSKQTILSLFLSYSIFAILLGSIAGSVMLAAVTPFPVNVRFSGSCIAFNISMSIFGGTAPLVALYLTNITHSEASPAFLLILAAVISLIALFIQKNIFQETNYVSKIRYENG